MAQTFTGFKGWTTLEQYNVYTGLATGIEKPNTPDQAEYVAPIASEECSGLVPIEDTTVGYYAHISQSGARDLQVDLRDNEIFGEGSDIAAPVKFSIPLSWQVDNGGTVSPMNETIFILAGQTSGQTETPTTGDLVMCVNTTATGVEIEGYTVTYVYSPDLNVCS